MIRYALLTVSRQIIFTSFVFFLSTSLSWSQTECQSQFIKWVSVGDCERPSFWTGICSGSYITDPQDNYYGACRVTCSRAIGNPEGFHRLGDAEYFPDVRLVTSDNGYCENTCSDYEYAQSFDCTSQYSSESDYIHGTMTPRNCCGRGQPPGEPLPECDPGMARYNGSTECTCPPDGAEICERINDLAGKHLATWHGDTCECKCENPIVWGIWLEEDCNNSGYCWKASYSSPDQSNWYEGTVNADYGRVYYWHQEDGGGGDITFFKTGPFFKGPSWFDIVVPSAYALGPDDVQPHWEDWGPNAHYIGSHSGGCGSWRTLGITHEDEPYIFEFNIWSGCTLVYYQLNVFPTCIGGCGLDWDNSKVDEIYQSLFTKIPFSLFSYASSFFNDLKSLGSPSSVYIPLPFYGYVEVPAMDLSWLRSGLFILLIVYLVTKIINYIL